MHLSLELLEKKTKNWSNFILIQSDFIVNFENAKHKIWLKLLVICELVELNTNVLVIKEYVEANRWKKNG